MKISENGLGVLSLYVPSVEMREHYSGDYVVGWIRYDFNDTGAAEFAVNSVKPHHSMQLLAANPKARQTQIISYALYDKESELIDSGSHSFNSFAWKECIPNTPGDTIWKVLMMVLDIYSSLNQTP